MEFSAKIISSQNIYFFLSPMVWPLMCILKGCYASQSNHNDEYQIIEKTKQEF